MINKKAIDNFLKRKLDSFDWLKKQGHRELDAEFASMQPAPDISKLWLHQKASLLILNELKRFILFVDMGGGKALRDDEPVLTPKGWKPISSLKVGEKVIGADGLPTAVTGVYPQGTQDVFDVEFSDGASVKCTKDHLWAVTTPTKRWRGEPFNVKALKDLGSLRDTNGWRRWFIPIAKPIEFKGGRGLPIDPYWLGLWLGDGCRNSTSITSADPEIFDSFKNNLPNGMRILRTDSEDNKASNFNFARPKNGLRRSANEFREGLRRLHLFDKYSYERFIPEAYLFATINHRLALLQGLMDTDGYISKDGKCYYDSSSPKLAADFAHLVRSLGGTATVSVHKDNGHAGHTSIYFVMPPDIIPCRIKRKVERLKGTRRRTNQPTRAITSITRVGRSKCTCISVAASDGLFITKDFVVTHNTLTTLTLLKYRKQCGEKIRCIVFVPFITSVETWVEQVKEHCPDLHCQPLTGSKVQNLNYIQNVDADLFVICYQSAVAMCSKETKNKKGKTKWNFSAEEIRKYFSGFNMLVCDELHKCKNVSSLTYRMCRAISAQAEYVVGLTGTPFGRDLIDLWPQFYLIDFGETLGPTQGFYQSVFYDHEIDFWGRHEYKFDKKKFPILKRAIQNCSISYGIDDLVDMPPKRYIKIKLSPTDENKGYCDNARRLLNAAIKAHDLVEGEKNYMQLRQLASGFMTLKGEDNEKFQVKFNDNPKLDALQDIIEGMPPDKKIVIFHHFVFTSELISERLKSMKIKHARIYGKTKDPISELRRFKDEPTCQALVINIKSGSSSLNLQNAQYMIFFEQPDSPIDRQQAERRIWRPGQKSKCLLYDLIMTGTADEKMRASNRAGENLLKELLNRRKEI